MKEDYPNGVRVLPIEQQIDAFERMYKLWILSFAEKLTDMPDSGFAVLNLLNAYPEMIAQLNGFTGNKPDLFKDGMLLLFPELRNSQQAKNICEHLYPICAAGLPI